VLLIVIVGIVNPAFFDLDNIFNLLRQSSFTFIIGLAITFVLVGGGLDLSVGSVLALGGVISGLARWPECPSGSPCSWACWPGWSSACSTAS
jgi:ribose/xylose/arabinose/galactoside ABC-type transport system permease subunit